MYLPISTTSSQLPETKGRLQLQNFPLSSMNLSLRTGIFDVHEQSPLHAWNLVYVPYCTSDAFMGSLVAFFWISFAFAKILSFKKNDSKRFQKQLVSAALLEHVQGSCHPCSLGRFRRCPGTGDGTFGSWHFRGARVVRAVLKKLKGRLESGKRPVPILSENHQSF